MKTKTIIMCLLLGIAQLATAKIYHVVQEQEPEVTILYASKPGEFPLSMADIKAGVFSNAIVKALSGKADKNKDGVISQSEFITYVRIATIEKSKGRQSVYVVNPWLDMKSSICGKVTHALAIGINYVRTQNTYTSTVPFAVSDARSIKESIQGQCKVSNVLSYTNEIATKKGIYEAINKMVSQANTEDVIIIAYSGLGVQVGGRYYIIPNDASHINSPEDMNREWVDIDRIIKMLSRSKNRHSLMLLDTGFGDFKDFKDFKDFQDNR